MERCLSGALERHMSVWDGTEEGAAAASSESLSPAFPLKIADGLPFPRHPVCVWKAAARHRPSLCFVSSSQKQMLFPFHG